MSAAVVAVVCGFVFFACAKSESLVTLGSGVTDNDGGGISSFVTPDAPAVVDVVAQCPSSECSPRYRTCPDSKFPCDVDVQNDSDHCGSCGVICPKGSYLLSSWTTYCADGQCRLLCDQNFADCNGKVEDGCEKEVFGDPENCGSCGFKCADGVSCIAGKCGCPTGQITCDGKCTDVENNDANCGACGNVCGDPDGGAPTPAPAHMYRGCLNRQCAQLKCTQSTASIPFVLWTDCNNNLADGCEVNLAADDANCITCGVSCGAGQKCSTMLQHWPPFVGCACPGGQTICPGPIADVANCIDMSSDLANCGACGVSCASTEACIDGICVLSCPPGTADCNGDHADGDHNNGCETNTDTDPLHCGSCTTQCDGQLPQPCQAGKCATRPCGTTGPVTK
ncbi:MAG: Tryptophan synthase alpha chain [Myxococcales bacterium]|nr:Tryptophan synthase alpha chain [Myxococcales bacterium]